jgi:enolase-phosphatase E1
MPALTPDRISSILLDIEGTTTPISFVHDVLFSYARSHVREYLKDHWDATETQVDLTVLCQEHALDMEKGLLPPAIVNAPKELKRDSIISYISWLIDRDRKSTGLKSLQGKIWKQGYVDGTLKSVIYADVAPALKSWYRAGLKISIFSSGSSLAQRLLFAHTDAGDLTKLITSYFDTTTGSKISAASYTLISSALRLPAHEILFISDATAELDAAFTAGMQTVLCARESNPIQPEGSQHRVIKTFENIF